MNNEEDSSISSYDLVKRQVNRLVGQGGPFELVGEEDGPPRFRRSAVDLCSLFRRVKLLQNRVQLKSVRDFTFGDIAREASRLGGFAASSSRYIGISDGDPFRWMVETMSAVSRGNVAVPVSGSEHVEAFRRQTGQSLRLDSLVGPAAISEDQIRPGVSISQAETNLREDPRRAAIALFTSGTSGTPKPVFHSHESVLTGLSNMLLAGSISAYRGGSAVTRQNGTPSVLLLCPLSYIAGTAQFLLSFLLGCKIIIPVDRSAEGLASAIKEDLVSSIVGISREQLSELLHLPGIQVTAESVRTIHVYGETLPADQALELTRVLPSAKIGQGYGMTEAFGPIAAYIMEDRDGPLFWKLPSIQAAVGSKSSLRSSGAGRLHIRGRNMMLGYNLSRDPTTSYEWFDTGDEVELSDSGKIRVLDRSSRFIESGDSNRTYFSDIERFALQADARDAAAWSEGGKNAHLIYLAVVADSDAEGRIKRVLADRYSFNLTVLFVSSIPRRHGGKIDTAALKKIKLI